MSDPGTSDAGAQVAAASAGPPGGPVRFPFGRVAIALVGIALAVWVWLGGSWRWEVTPEELLEGSPGRAFRGGWVGRYVRLRARPGSEVRYNRHPEMAIGVALAYEEPREDRNVFIAFDLASAERIAGSARRSDGIVALSGRVVTASYPGVEGDDLVVDATRGRLTGRSFLAIFMGLWGAAIGAVAVLVWRARSRAIPVA